MGIATGVNTQLAYKVESTWGTAPGASGGQLLRRTETDLNLSKDTYQSNEKRPDFQVADFRHGVRRAAGKLSGELSPKTYSDFFAAALKRDFSAVAPSTGLSITIALVSGVVYKLTRGAGSWLTDGLKVGMVGRLTAGSFNVANSGKNLLIVGVTALDLQVMTLNGSALVAEGPIASATFAVTGKQTYIPQSGHTDKSFAIERFFPEVPASELFTGCKIDKIGLNLPPTGMATVDFDFVGKDIVPGTGQYFTAPTAVTSTPTLAAVNGVLRVGGQIVATVTGLTVEIDPTFSGDPVVGANTIAGLFPGKVQVSGQMTVYFDSTVLRDAFVNETEIDLVAAFTTDNTATADFLAIALPRIKIGGAGKNDADGGIVQTMPFQALLNVNGGTGIATEKTTIQIQDSQA